MLVITVLSLVGFTLRYVIYREVKGQTLRIITPQIDDSDDVLLDISTQTDALVH
ncbi:hypothetical protein [Erysipelothrix larvae]|uniref:hypothetical protein n=1 Tax=Erysipelothrix larvae TaxID=1514105 RepID=UPI0012FD6197|nr:hypothetical protein [Erysipelothrix larvae]